MCGISGYSLLDKNKFQNEFYNKKLLNSLNIISHRGPDDKGFDFYSSGSVGFAHSRLAIQDLSAKGHQPMETDDKRYSIIFNGEIYNANEIRKDLVEKNSIKFKSESDTEVILKLFEVHNKLDFKIINFLKKLDGIFAFAIWDNQKESLILARDAFGVKPLYYNHSSSGFFFSSEIKGLIELLPDRNNEEKKKDIDRIDIGSLDRYLTYLWNPGFDTPSKILKKIGPGEVFIIKDGLIEKKIQWFKLPSCIKKNYKEIKSKKYYIERTQFLLRKAVHKQMLSDTTVGSFLSGGLDSSSIVAFSRELNKDIPCFTINNNNLAEEGIEDDLPYAKKVASYLNVPLEIIDMDSGILIQGLKDMIIKLEEPLADPAAINVLYISRLARKNGIKVLLSGSGGDDLFSGYRRHMALTQEKWWTWLPINLRKKLYFYSDNFKIKNSFLRRVKKAFSGAHLDKNERILNYFRWINRKDLENLYTDEFKKQLFHKNDKNPMEEFLYDLPNNLSSLEKILSLEQRFFLTDHNLIYTDKMSMQEGVEVRVPFLDLDLVDFASTIPSKYKQRGFHSKWILKKAMEPYLPREIIYRSKSGFGAPLRNWIRFDMHEWLMEILSEDRLKNRGIFKPHSVHDLILKNQSCSVDVSYTLFGIACVELWCTHFLDNSSI